MSHNPINPATGLPMIDDGYGGVDVGGNPTAPIFTRITIRGFPLILAIWAFKPA